MYPCSYFVLLLHFSTTAGVYLNWRTSVYRRFTDVTAVQSMIVQAQSQYLLVVGLFNSTHFKHSVSITANSSKFDDEPAVPSNTGLTTASFTSFWFQWSSDHLQFGLGKSVDEHILGIFAISDGKEIVYLAYTGKNDYLTRLQLPDHKAFSFHKGYKINVAIFKYILTASSSIMCSAVCLNNPRCYAFNYRAYPTTENCLLIENTAGSRMPFTFSPDKDWNYFFLQQT